jgi:hypothetical protein
MPSPLPSEDELVRVLRLNESADQRLQAISFFLLGLLICAAIVRWLWNYVARDFPVARLSYGKALAGVILWGLLFVLVLTMISGARELMTPGAWKKQGFTYKLTDIAEPSGDLDPPAVRRRHLEQLRQALWHFAATHQGRFPNDVERAAMPADLWTVPETGGLHYRYLPGRSTDGPAVLLVVAPEVESGRRLVLRTDGTIADLSAADFDAIPWPEGR